MNEPKPHYPMLTTNGTPRRSRVDLMTPAEVAIHNAIDAVERLGADVRLTDAVTLLSHARETVADYLEGKTPASIRLGSKVVDTISGFKGIATARTEYLYGCVRIGVSAVELKDGRVIEAGYFDEQQLRPLSDSTEFTDIRGAVAAEKPGGPGDAPPERRAPPVRES